MYVGKREYETIPLTDHWVFLYTTCCYNCGPRATQIDTEL